MSCIFFTTHYCMYFLFFSFKCLRLLFFLFLNTPNLENSKLWSFSEIYRLAVIENLWNISFEFLQIIVLYK